MSIMTRHTGLKCNQYAAKKGGKMTVSELIEVLEQQDPDLKVVVPNFDGDWVALEYYVDEGDELKMW